MWPCGRAHEGDFAGPRLFYAVPLASSAENQSSRESRHTFKRDNNSPRSRCACSRPSALPSQAAGGRKVGVALRPAVFKHHNYPFVLPLHRRGVKVRPFRAFARRMIDARQFTCAKERPVCQQCQPCFAQVMPILRPLVLTASTACLCRQRARSWPSQCEPETSCVMSPSCCQRTYMRSAVRSSDKVGSSEPPACVGHGSSRTMLAMAISSV